MKLKQAKVATLTVATVFTLGSFAGMANAAPISFVEVGDSLNNYIGIPGLEAGVNTVSGAVSDFAGDSYDEFFVENQDGLVITSISAEIINYNASIDPYADVSLSFDGALVDSVFVDSNGGPFSFPIPSSNITPLNIEFSVFASEASYDYTIAITAQGNSPNPVPEPSTMLLFGLGTLGLIAHRRKKV